MFKQNRVFSPLFKRSLPNAKLSLALSALTPLATILLSVTLLTTNLLSTAPKATAAASTNLNFQARLLQNAGNVVPDGYYNIEFNIYNVSSGGTSLWSERYLVSNTQGVRTVNGYISVSLGTLDSLADETDINWNEENWLGMTIRGTTNCAWGSCSPTDSEMTPRMKLTAVPYAFQAQELAKTSGANRGTLAFGAITNNPAIVLPDASGTVCLQSSSSCGFLTGSGTAFLQGGNTFSGTTDGDLGTNNNGNLNFRTNGTTKLTVTTAGNLTFAQASTISTSTGNLTLSAGGASVDVAAGKALRVIGGNTASRPGSPTEGMVYFDTDTSQLLVYQNGKWKADTGEAYLVAANNSSAADKAAADYIADGTSDEDEINAALDRADPASATGGARKSGKVYLFAGTFVADGTILVKNNTTLAGAGRGTVIELADIDATDNLIENSDTSTGTGVAIRDLRLEGRKDLNTAGTQSGIHLNNMGGGAGASARQGAKITNVISNSFRNRGFSLSNSSNNTLTGNTAQSNGDYGFLLSGSSYNTLTGNNSQDQSGSYGFYLLASSDNNTLTGNTAQGNSAGFVVSSSYNTLTGNTAQGGGTSGFVLISATNTTLSGNTSQGNSSYGFSLSSSSSNSIVGNNVAGNTSRGISLDTSNNNVVSANKIDDSGSGGNNNGVYLTAADNNSITGNNITDTSCGTGTTSCFAINISNSTSDTNYIADNTYSDTDGDATATINDAGTGTIYGGQLIDTNDYILQGMNNVSIGTLTSDAKLEVLATSTSTSAGTLKGGELTVTDTGVVTTGTDTTYGQRLVVTRTGATGGTINTYGLDIQATADNAGAGTSTLTGLNVNVSGADTNYAAIFQGGNVGIGTTSPDGLLDVQSDSSILAVFQEASGADALTVDTSATELVVRIGDVSTSNGTLLVLDSDDADPTGENGAQYYNTVSNTFRCYENGAWKDCAGAGATTTMQQAYDNSTTPVTVTLSSTDDSILFRNPASSGTDLGYLFQTQNLATGMTTADFKNLQIANSGSFNTTAGNLTNYGLHVDNASTESAGSNTLTNVGLYVNASGADTNYSAIFQGGNVGIGTTTPGALLDVAGTTSSALRLIASGGSPLLHFRDSSTGNDSTITLDGSGSLIFNQESAAGALKLTSSGSLGVNTSGPDRKLDVLDASSPQLRLTHTDGSIYTDLQTPSTGGLSVTTNNLTSNGAYGIQGSFTIAGSASSQTYYGNKVSVTNNQATNANTVYGQHISFTDSGSLANTVTGLYVDATTANSSDTTYSGIFQGGNAGIGTTSPDRRLDVLDATNPQLRLTYTDGSVYSELQTDSNGYLVISGTGNRVQIGATTPDATGVALVLDNKNTAGDPTGTNGAMYYNSNSNKFRCYENSAWKDCAGSGGSTTLQDSYDNDANGSDAVINLTSTDGGVLIRDNATPLGTTLFAIQNSAGTANYLKLTASDFTLQDSSGNNSLLFTPSTGHLKVYGTGGSSAYADIYYDVATSTAVFAASSGTTQIGTGSGGGGDINFILSNAADTLTATHTSSTLGATYTDTDYAFRRNLTVGSQAANGNVLSVEDLTGLGTGSSAPNLLYLNQNTSGATGNLILAQTGGSTDRFVVTTAGTVGIGTASPGALVHASGTSTGALNGMFIDNVDQGASSTARVSLRLQGTDSVTDVGATLEVGKEQTWTSTASTRDAYFAIRTRLDNNSTERLRVTSAGNVGIGTTAPIENLVVSGTASEDTTMLLQNADTGGTAADGLGLILGGNETTYLWNYENTDLVVGTNNTERLRILAGGNVGIGTATPTEKLQVAGNLLISNQPNDAGHNFTSCSCSLNSAAGTFGSQTARDAVTASLIFRGKLFVAVKETDNAGIYRYDGGTTWTLVTNAVGKAVTGDTANIDQYVMTVWNGTMYIGSQTGANTAGVYSSTTADTTADSFTLVNATRGQFTLASNDGISDLVVYNGGLYVGTQEPNLAEVLRYDGGTTFTQVSSTTEGRIGALASTTVDGVVFAVYGGRLFAGNLTGSGGNAARVSVYTGVGTTWTDLAATAGTIGTVPETLVDDISGITVWDGALYISTAEPNASNVYRWEAPINSSDATAANWKKVSNANGKLASSDTANIDSAILRTYRGRLYAGSYNATDGTGALYEYAGVSGTWTLINGTRGTFNSETAVDGITALQELNGTLYVGIDDGTAGKASVYTFTKAEDQSYALRFEGPSTNYGAIRFVGSEQALDNQGRQGTFNFSHGITMSSGAFDYAEDYPTLDSDLEPGEPVAVDPAFPEHVKRAKPGDVILGVVSEDPGLRLSSDAQPASGAKWIPIALVGRVPVKVTTHDGSNPIKPGDMLALSNIPGVLEKAGAAGQVVGSALEGFDGAGVTKIMMYVNPTWNISEDALATLTKGIEGVSLSSANGLTIKTLEGDIAANINRLGHMFVQSATIGLDLDVEGGLDVRGIASFHGNSFFYKLVTFVEKTVFKNDLSLEGHFGTNGQVLSAELDQAAGITEMPYDNPEAILAQASVDGNDVSGQFALTFGDNATAGSVVTLKFIRPYGKAPQVLLTANNDQAAQVQYYVQSTPEGFKLFILNTPTAGTAVHFNYWVVENQITDNSQ